MEGTGRLRSPVVGVSEITAVICAVKGRGETWPELFPVALVLALPTPELVPLTPPTSAGLFAGPPEEGGGEEGGTGRLPRERFRGLEKRT